MIEQVHKHLISEMELASRGTTSRIVIAQGISSCTYLYGSEHF